jgi:cytochrome c oxidase cbb3-type subunit 4
MLDMGDMRGAITVVTMVCFLGIFWWAYRSGNRRRFEEDAQIPFRENDAATKDAGVTQPSERVTSMGAQNDE